MKRGIILTTVFTAIGAIVLVTGCTTTANGKQTCDLSGCTYTINNHLEKLEKTEKRTTNLLLLVRALGFVALYVFAYLFNALFHSIANKKSPWAA